MASSNTEICNLALGHLGIGKSIVSLDTERSEEANSCRRFYDLALERSLRDFNWPFSKRLATLALVSENPNEEYDFAYRYPTQCVKIHRILSGSRNDSRQTRVHFTIGSDSSGQLIYTDQPDAVVWYSYLETDPDKYTPDFVMALSYLIAHYVAPALTAGDPFKMGERAFQQYAMEISRAQSNALMEEQPEEVVQSELIRARD